MRHIKLYENFESLNLLELSSKYKYFHLSWDQFHGDGKTFTFTPRVPAQPYNFETGSIEDDFTERISISDSIKGCLDALPEDDEGTWFIYGTTEIKDIVSVKDNFKNCPVGYGKNFDMMKWVKSLPENERNEIERHINDLEDVNWKYGVAVSDLPNKYRDMFYGCVPDANDHNEYWALSPLKMDYIGKIDSDDVAEIYQNGLDNVYPKK